MPATAPVTTFLFTDIEGSTRLWEQMPDAMRPALARHDAIVRTAVLAHGGHVVKTTGDGVHAAFDDALDAVRATVELQHALNAPEATGEIVFHVRCGLHVGRNEQRDNDFYGTAVNRAARIMSAAHGGQMLASQALADDVVARLPDGIALRDLGVVRLRDLADPERIFQILDPGLRRDFPPLRSLEATPNNLPQQLTSFIGRARELGEVRERLASTRLLTLLGIGGLGKSRLSLQVAADVLDDFPDGVWFVELAPVSDARLVPQVLASLLGVREDAGGSVLEALVRYVRKRALLIILDNCEHLTQACAELARALLEAGPRVKVMASSREHLNVRGETAYPLAPLVLPDPDEKLPLDAYLEGEAVRLFFDRATAASPSFVVNERTMRAVTAICRRLDGIPLALELAAARVRALSVENIADRLHDRFRLLSGGDRTALPRQQTLRALIDWSFDLLTQAERVLFRRLSVFAGGFTLEAAEAVGAGAELEEADVLDLLARLVEKSLVVLGPGGTRYRMLETVRQYAQEKLGAADERDATRLRHLDYYVMFTDQARQELTGPDQGAWLAKLDVERENVLVANDWCDHAPTGAEQGLTLMRSMQFYWIYRGLFGLGHRIATGALARAAAQGRTLSRCRGLFHAGRFSLFVGRYEEAARQLQECLSIARELGERPAMTAVLPPLAVTAIRQGDRALARRYLTEALDVARALANRREVAASLNELAQLDRLEGNLEEARTLYEQVLATARALDDRASIAVALLNLAMVAALEGRQPAAREMLTEVHAIAKELDSRPAGQSLLDVCAGLAALQDDWAGAARFFGAAEALREQLGLHRHPADDAFLQPLVARARAALSASSAGAEAEGRTTPYEEMLLAAQAWLGQGPTPAPANGLSTSR